MSMVLKNKLDEHEAALREKVFQIDNKWPHYQLLLADLRSWSAKLPQGSFVVSLERTLLYGGISLFAPFFAKQNCLIIDCSPSSADQRGAYNQSIVNDSRLIKIPFHKRSSINDIVLENDVADLLIVPNLIHHIKEQDTLFKEIARIVKPGGHIYIFEPLIRELHQIPDDYLRYTPYGIAERLASLQLEVIDYKMEGGPFSAIAYCWTQALEYFPPEKRSEMENWFYRKHFAELMAWDDQYQRNLVRTNTAFPMAYSIVAKKRDDNHV